MSRTTTTEARAPVYHVHVTRRDPGIKYRLTQRRLQRKLAEANTLILKMLDRGIVPEIMLHPVRGNALARTVSCHHWRKGRG